MTIVIRANSPGVTPPPVSGPFLIWNEIRANPTPDLLDPYYRGYVGKINPIPSNEVLYRYIGTAESVISKTVGSDVSQTSIMFSNFASPNDTLDIVSDLCKRYSRSSLGIWSGKADPTIPPLSSVSSSFCPLGNVTSNDAYFNFSGGSLFRWDVFTLNDLVPTGITGLGVNAKIIDGYHYDYPGLNRFIVMDATVRNNSFVVLDGSLPDASSSVRFPPSGGRLITKGDNTNFENSYYATIDKGSSVEVWTLDPNGSAVWEYGFTINVAADAKWMVYLNGAIYIGLTNGYQYRVLPDLTHTLCATSPAFADPPADCYGQRSHIINNKSQIYSPIEVTPP